MVKKTSETWLAADRAHCWHPFTDQSLWTAPDHEPLVIERGEGVWLYDSEGRKYLDANSSIWTNIHGHAHPEINAAITAQLELIAHSSYLGFANPRASELAQKLCGLFPENVLPRCFFSDDGSTALEVALKMATQFFQQNGEPQRTKVIAFENAYHGDTLGAASIGGVGRFHHGLRGYESEKLRSFSELEDMDEKKIAAIVIEPKIQGVNEIRLWPEGFLRELRSWCDAQGVLLIFDEVMTGFGRTGKMFASQHEEAWPDFLCLAKGLSGGYLALAATLTTERIYEGFLGPGKTFYYGHSFTGNQLGCAAALASLALFERPGFWTELDEKIALFHKKLHELEKLPEVFSVRQCGLVAGVEFRQSDGGFFKNRGARGLAVCAELRERGILTRPILDTVVLMPPLSITLAELDWLLESFAEVC